MSRILAIDYGLKVSGVAVSDPAQQVALPLATVPSPQLLSYCQRYVSSEPVDGIVLGWPLSLSGDENAATEAVYRLAQQLHHALPSVSIYLEDERFTSQMAWQTRLTCGVNRKARRDKSVLHPISAVFILRTFLAKHQQQATIPKFSSQDGQKR